MVRPLIEQRDVQIREYYGELIATGMNSADAWDKIAEEFPPLSPKTVKNIVTDKNIRQRQYAHRMRG